MKNNNINITSSSEQDPPRPRPDVALVEPEQATAAQEQNSVVQDEGQPSTGVENSTPLQGQETAGMGTSDQQVNSTSNTSEPLDDDAPQTQNNDAETGSSESVTAQYVVCKGATCKCDGNPAAKATLEVTTHKKYYVNDDGNDKLIATIADITFREGVTPFITCSHKKGYDKTCTYAPMGKWEVPNNSRFPEVGGKNILTEKGKLECIIGGKIDFLTHGQTVTVDNEDIQEVEEAFVDMSQINSLVSYENPGDTSVEDYVSNVNSLTLSNQNEIRSGAIKEGGRKSLYVLVNEELKFEAITPSGETNHYISWSITEVIGSANILAAGKKGETSVIETSPENTKYLEKKTTSRYYTVFPLRAGTYIVSAARKPKSAAKKPYFHNFYYYLEVVDQASIIEVKYSNGEQNVTKGEEITVSVSSNLKLTEAECRAVSIEVYMLEEGTETHLQSYRAPSIEPVAGSMRYTQTNNVLQAKIKFNNIGKYKIKVFKDSEELTAFSKEIKTIKDEVVQIAQVPDVIRRGAVLSFTAKLKNGQQIDESQIRWRLMLPDGLTYGEEKTGKTAPFTFADVGTYTIQCFYGNRLFLQVEKVQVLIEVKANQIENVSVPLHEAVESGKVFKAYVKNKIKLRLDMLFNYEYEAVSDSGEANAFELHDTKAKALLVDTNRASKKDAVLVFSVAYAGAKAAEDSVKLSIGGKKLHFEKGPVYFTSTKSELDLELNEQGKYVFTAQLGNNQSRVVVLDCVYGEIKKWHFHDGKRKISRLGYKQNFGVSIVVEGWTNKKGKLNIWWDNRTDGGTILKHFKTEGTIEKERHQLIYSQEVTFDRNGVINRMIKPDSTFWQNLLDVIKEKKAKDKIFNFYFTVSDIEVPCVNQNERIYDTTFRKGHVFPSESKSSGSYVTLEDKMQYAGYFVDKDKKYLEAIVQYTDKPFIALGMHKGLYTEEDQTIYEIHIYENKKGEDSFIEGYNLVGNSTEILNHIELPTAEAQYGFPTHEKDKENAKIPRLFYFIMYRWRGEHHDKFISLKGQPAKKISEISSSNVLSKIMMYPIDLGVRSWNDNSIIVLEDEDKQKYIAGLNKEKADKIRSQEINQKNMGIALEGTIAGGKQFKSTAEKFTETYNKIAQEIKVIDKELETLAIYNARIQRNDAKLVVEKKGVKNYFKQLKLAIDPIYNEIQDRNKKVVGVKVESGEAQTTPTRDGAHTNCPRCNAAVKGSDLQKLFPDTDIARLETIAKGYTDYMNDFKMNTCWNKAHFFAQAMVEVGTSILLTENLNYDTSTYDKKVSFLNTFISRFFINENAGRSQKWKSKKSATDPLRFAENDDNRVFKNQKAYDAFYEIVKMPRGSERTKYITNYVYSDENGATLGNTHEGDGWRFRGKGFCQVTGRGNFTDVLITLKGIRTFENLSETDDASIDELVEKMDNSEYYVVPFTMAHWKNKTLQEYSNLEEDTDAISLAIGPSHGYNGKPSSDTNYSRKKTAFEGAGKAAEVFKTKECTFTYFPDQGDGVLEMMKRFVIKGWPYSQLGSRVGVKYKDIKEVDCSEVVALYLYNLGIVAAPIHLDTSIQTTESAFRNALSKTASDTCTIDHVDGKDGVFDPNFEPQRGDIFVWRRLKPGKTSEDGHTGIVYAYDKSTQIVTILEAITESSDIKTHINTKFGNLIPRERDKIKNSGVENNKTRISYYKLNGGALQTHAGWKGYFRPKGYSKKL